MGHSMSRSDHLAVEWAAPGERAGWLARVSSAIATGIAEMCARAGRSELRVSEEWLAEFERSSSKHTGGF